MDDLDIGEEIFPRRLFYKRKELMGTLSKGEESITNLHVILQYPLDKPGVIKGKVLGTQKTASQIYTLSDIPGPYMQLTAKSRFESPYAFKFKSDKVLCKMVTVRSEPEGTQYYVADLVFDEITEREVFDVSFHKDPHIAQDMPNRYLTFYLAGPTILWGIYWEREVSFTGNSKVEVHESRLDLSQDLPYEVSILPWYFTDQTDDPSKYSLQSSTYALTLKTTKNQAEYSDQEFLQSGQTLADDLTAIASIGSCGWVVWFGYSLRSTDSLLTYRRITREPGAEQVTWESLPINSKRNREFLRSCLSEYRKLREEGIDLLLPITYYLNGRDHKKGLEESFTFLFLALEKIKDNFAFRKNLKSIVDRSSFAEVESSVKGAIKEKLGDSCKAELMFKKVPELNRPSIKQILKGLFEELQIDCSDLYPPSHDCFSFIEMRNRLFHSSESINPERLWMETSRLTYIVERVLLRLLGWDDLSLSPRVPEKLWLSSDES